MQAVEFCELKIALERCAHCRAEMWGDSAFLGEGLNTVGAAGA